MTTFDTGENEPRVRGCPRVRAWIAAPDFSLATGIASNQMVSRRLLFGS